MRVLFCQTTPYPPEEFGGALSNTHALCRLLQARGFDVAVLAGRRPLALHSMLKSIYRRNSLSLGYPVHREHDPVVAVRSLCRRNKPALAVVQLGDIGGLVQVFLEEQVPVVVYFHDLYSVGAGAMRSREKLVSYAACSEFLAGKISALFGCDVSVLPVIVTPEDYRVESERRVVTFVNPIPRKGLEIAFTLASFRPDIPFEFVEGWQLRERVVKYLRARAAHHGNVRVLRNTTDVRALYRRSRLVLAPSLWEEAWGRVVSEAQVSGIPALASDAGGLPEAIGPGGLIVARTSPVAEWVRTLGRLWDDASEYKVLSTRAAEYAARPDFQPAAVAARVAHLLKAKARIAN
jgi:glycosyltransferase involved in cell wall biosynthesis